MEPDSLIHVSVHFATDLSYVDPFDQTRRAESWSLARSGWVKRVSASWMTSWQWRWLVLKDRRLAWFDGGLADKIQQATTCSGLPVTLSPTNVAPDRGSLQVESYLPSTPHGCYINWREGKHSFGWFSWWLPACIRFLSFLAF